MEAEVEADPGHSGAPGAGETDPGLLWSHPGNYQSPFPGHSLCPWPRGRPLCPWPPPPGVLAIEARIWPLPSAQRPASSLISSSMMGENLVATGRQSLRGD